MRRTIVFCEDIDHSVYQGLGVQEVWFWENGQFSLYSLTNPEAGYEPVGESQLLPGLDLAAMAQFVDYSSQTQAVKAFRRALGS